MGYFWGIIAVIYGTVLYKGLANLRSLRAGAPKLKMVEPESEFKNELDRLVEPLELVFLGQFLEDPTVVSQGHANHHFAYTKPGLPLVLWFYLTELGAEQRAAVLEVGDNGEVKELEPGDRSWMELWNEQSVTITPGEASNTLEPETLAQAVVRYQTDSSKPLLEAYAQEAEDGTRRLSWGQSFSLLFKLIGKGQAGITCDKTGKLVVRQRKEHRAPDLDQLGHHFHEMKLMALLDLKFRESEKKRAAQQKRSRWILPVSLIAFFVSFMGWFDWRTILILAAVVFIHELGHWAAMKIFGYKNTTFMFLPFFGGLAMGQKKSPKLYETVLVLLAGPVPGVLLAVALALAFPSQRQPILNQFILMLWIINLINLLPIVPLDGGRIVSATFFSKTPRAELVFRWLTAIALLYFYWKADDPILLFLGVVVLTNTGNTKKVADVCHHYRKQQATPSDLEVALDTYERFQFDPNKHVQTVRSKLLEQVFHRLESSGAGWGVSLLWLFIYAACLVGSLGIGMTRLLG